MRNKIFLLILALMFVFANTAESITASNIEWWSANTASGLPSDTLKQWTEGIEGRVGGNIGTGNQFYVDSKVAIEGDGSSWTAAKDTIEEAIALCAANNGDVIYLAPGHAETLSADASDIDINVIGVSIIGIGSGSDMPKLTYTHAGATINITVANVSIKNIRFVCGVSAVVSSITLAAGADYLTISDCIWDSPATSTFEFYDMITLAAGSDYVTIAGNQFISLTATTGCNQAINTSVGIVNRLSIVGNEFQGAWTVAAIFGNKLHTNSLVANNVVYQTSSGQFGIEFDNTAAATGLLYGNLVYTNAVATAIDPASMACFENYIINTVDLSAELFPPVSAIGTVTAGSASDILKKLYYTADGTNAFPATVADDSTLAKIMGTGAIATVSGYDNTTMSLQALNVDLDAILTNIAAISGVGLRGTCEINAGGAANFTSIALAGFGNDFFNTGWYAIVTYDAGGVAGAPEAEIRDITDYVTATGVFTVGPAFSAAVTTGDKVKIVYYKEIGNDDVTILGGSGKILYVDSGKAGTSSTGELGKTWDNAYTTIALAIAGATASNGDVIYVAPGHGETLAAAVAINVAGVSIIGLGEGTLRPTITLDTAADQWDVSAANIHIENIRFLAGATDILKGIDLAATADGAHIKNCIFEDATTSEILNAIDIAAACDDVIIEGCQILTPGNAATEGIKVSGAVDNLKIIDNWIFGTFTVAGIWSNSICTNILVKDNVVTQLTSGQYAVEFAAAATGNLVNNTLSSPLFATMLDPGSMICSGNMGSSVLDEAGIPIPISALTTDITADADGSDLERLEYLQYWSETTVYTTADEITENLFTVTGGPILITSLVGYVDVLIGANATTCKTGIDATAGAGYDFDFSTAVAIETDAVGTTYVFSNANPAVLTPLTPGASGLTNLMMPWYCPAGVVIQTMSADPGGAGGDHITWYMTWKPLKTGVTVAGSSP